MKKIDLTGKRFGKLVVIRQAENHKSKNGSSRTCWHCKCDCGNELDVIGLNLTRNHTTSCGCVKKSGADRLIRDVTNERFGHLVGIRKIESKNGKTRWLFKCDCGNEVECFLSNVTTGKTKTCGKECKINNYKIGNKKKGYRSDLTGQKIGRLLVLEKLPDKNGWTQFKCKCDCGNETIVSGNALRYGITQSCGCLQKEKSGAHLFEDLTGKRFGKLVVIRQAETKYSKIHWLCKCDCGNETIVSTSGLKSGHTSSCGCYQYEGERSNFNDLTGKTFGKLKVISRAENSKTGLVRYLCKCDCGNETIVASGHLISGNIQSCGCWKQSHMEGNVVKYFKSKGYINTIDYECQKKFENLTGKGNYMLSYDFIFYKNNEPFLLIECQGQQHYYPVDYFGGKKRFEQQQHYDELKREYAKSLGIPLLEIPYTIKKYSDICNILSEYDI